MSSKNQWKGEEEFVKELSKFKEIKPPIPASKINKIAKLASLNSQYYKYVVYAVERFMNKYVSQYEDCNLTSIYIIDAICKYSKSKYGEKDKFCARFEKNLDHNFSMLCKGKSSSDKTFHSLNRTLSFWEKNNMFNLDLISKLRLHLPTHLTYEKLEGDGISTNNNTNATTIENLALNLPDLQGLDPNQPDTLNLLMNILMSGNNKSDHDQLVYQHKKDNLLEMPTGNSHGDFNLDPSLLTSNYENLEPNNNPNNNSNGNIPPLNPSVNNNNPPPQGGMYNPTNPEGGFGGQFDNYNNPNIQHNPNTSQGNLSYNNNNQYFDHNQPQDFNNIPNNFTNNNFPPQDNLNNFPPQEKNEHFGTIRIRTKTLWLGNVSNDLSDEIVTNACKEFGRIASVKYLPLSFIAFATYVTRLEAENAHSALQGYTINGKTWKIGWANGDFLDKTAFDWQDGSGPLNKSKLKFPKFQFKGQTIKNLIEFNYEIDESSLDYSDPLQKSLSNNPNINPELNSNNKMGNNNMGNNMMFNPNMNNMGNKMGMHNPNVNFNPNSGFGNNNNVGLQNNMMENNNNAFNDNNNNRFGGRNNFNNNNNNPNNRNNFDDTDKFLNDLKNNPHGGDDFNNNRKFSRGGGDNNNNYNNRRGGGDNNNFRRNDNENNNRRGGNNDYDNNRRNDRKGDDNNQPNNRFGGDRVSKFSGGHDDINHQGNRFDNNSRFDNNNNNRINNGGNDGFNNNKFNDNPHNNRFDNNNNNNRFDNNNGNNNNRFNNGGNDGRNFNNNNKRDNRNNFNRRDDRTGDYKRNKRDD